MFAQLVLKECRQTAKSMIYWLIVIILVLFFNSQLGNLSIAEKPEPGQENYGRTYSEDKQDIMEATLGNLVSEYTNKNYSTYPIGFYKTVKPDKDKQNRIGEIIAETTGLKTEEEMEKAMLGDEAGQPDVNVEGGSPIVFGSAAITPAKGLTYDRFKELMEEVDDLLGGGSMYSKDRLKTNAMTGKTYEQALKEYEDLTEKDHLTGGYARLFCDYMGIMLGILPVFLAVTRGMRDRRSQMRELIASRQASSTVIVVSRYVSMLIMLILPVLLISCIPLAECVQSAGAGVHLDYLAFVKYSFGWLLPTIMIAAAVGMVLTELTDTALAVLIQLAWWFITVFSSIISMSGGMYGWSMVPRHNTIYNYAGFQEGFAQLAANRAFYAVLSMVLVAVTVWIYSLKRKGRLDIRGKLLGNRKRKSQA